MPHKDYSYCTTIYKHQSFKHLGTFGVQIDFAEDMAIEALELGTRNQADQGGWVEQGRPGQIKANWGGTNKNIRNRCTHHAKLKKWQLQN